MRPVSIFIRLLLNASLVIHAQTVSRNLTDGLTPPAVAPGAPPGVKTISSLESINLYNGQLSATIPLLQVGGRGEAGYELVARVGTAPWTITMDTIPFCPIVSEPCTGFTHNASASNRDLYPFESPYSPGLVFGKRSGAGPILCGNSGVTAYTSAFTHLVFERPDGSQLKLWDNGEPSGGGSGCPSGGANRGKRFTAMGGSQIVFLSDADIVDDLAVMTPDKFAVSGRLLFPNGVEYRVDGSKVTRITDRNGNFTTIRYQGITMLPDLITDSAGRTISITHDTETQAGAGDWADRITYKGYAGVNRTIVVQRVRFGQFPLRSGLPATGAFQNAAMGFRNFDRLLRTITLPDARTYQFQYTAYGELAKMILPTGGAIEYDHGPGLSNTSAPDGMYPDGGVLDSPGTIANTNDSDPGWRPAIYRRLQQRRTYPDGGVVAESTTTYSLRESGSNPVKLGTKVTALTITSSAYVEESLTAANVPSPIITRHWFFENNNAPRPSWASMNARPPLQAMLQTPGSIRMPADDNVFEGVEYKTSQPGFSTTEKGFVLALDVTRALRVCQETVLVGDSTAKRAETLLSYDTRGNITETYAYAFGVGPALTRVNDVPTACGSPGTTQYLRRTATAYKNDATYLADNRHLLRLPITEETFGPGGVQVAKTAYEYDLRPLRLAEQSTPPGFDGVERTERGNITAISRYTSGSAALTTALQYDVLGNVRNILPPNLVANTTSSLPLDQLTNAGAWTYGAACGSAFVLGEQLPPATNGGTAFSTSTIYDCWLGQPTSFTDINNVQTVFDYGTAGSNMDKLTLVKRAAGSTVETRTTYDYGLSPSNIYVTTASSVFTATDGAAQTKSVFDGFGRETESRQWNGSAWIITKKEYDGAHRLKRVYNPTTGAPSSFTDTTYDSMGRPTLVTTPDGSKTSYAYSENQVTVTDPGNVSKKTATDALGRLESVTEDPAGAAIVTQYFYDANGNLLTVCPTGGTLSQSGACSGVSQARSFSYDWLSRLRTAANPESSVITYNYDETASTNGTGNLTSKSQLRGVSVQATVTTRFHYDNLGRMTSKAYTGTADNITTPGVTYTYDTHNPAIAGIVSFPKGRRTRVAVTGGTVTAIDSYDELGRPTRSRQETATIPYRFGADTVVGYEYLRNGAVSVMRLPTTRTLTYAFDSVGRLKGISDGTKQYVTNTTYTDHGAIGTIRMNGQLLRERYTYDPLRLQITGIAMEKCSDDTVVCGTLEALRTLGYTYGTAGAGNGGGPNNNGNVRTQSITDPGVAAATQSYGYDAWNRLTTFTEGSLSETNCYDEHGNRAVLQRAGLSPLTPQVTQCTAAAVRGIFPGNRLALTSYDAAGGISNDGRSEVRYDAEDRVVKTWPALGGPETAYTYDGDGKRISLGSTVFVYDAAGKLAVEYGGIVTTSGVEYVGVDHLGSTRSVIAANGTVTRRMDYWPFGTELSSVDTSWRTAALGFVVDARVRAKFTGKERDAETGLDYFGARYFSGAQGRFTSPDLPLYDQSPFDPQSWNLYSYGRNNPLVNIDPSGRSCVKTQTVNPDGSTSGSSADDGDGKGCEAAGIKPDDKGGLAASGQQVNVSGKQGSLWDYLTTTVPRYVPNDTELPSGARNVFSKVYQNTWVIAQPLCSGGGFVFLGGGGNIPGTKIHAEGYVLPVDYESGKGFSSGVLGEVGIGHTPFAVGGEAAVNWKTGQKSYAGLAFANRDIAGVKGGVASVGLLGDTHGNIGGYASLSGVGVGVYGRPSFINGCPAH